MPLLLAILAPLRSSQLIGVSVQVATFLEVVELDLLIRLSRQMTHLVLPILAGTIIQLMVSLVCIRGHNVSLMAVVRLSDLPSPQTARPRLELSSYTRQSPPPLTASSASRHKYHTNIPPRLPANQAVPSHPIRLMLLVT